MEQKTDNSIPEDAVANDGELGEILILHDTESFMILLATSQMEEQSELHSNNNNNNNNPGETTTKKALPGSQ